MEWLQDKYSTYTVIDININLNIEPEGNWNDFKCILPCNEAQKVGLYKVRILKELTEIHGLEYYNISKSYNMIVRKGQDIMLVNHAWENALILPIHENANLNNLLCQFFYTKAIQKHIVYFHSSLISYNGMGIMFLGPSGIGKTTQAELWSKYCGARIINGDVVFVEEKKRKFFGWGTPWHGSSPYCENANVPVRALIVLKQGEINSIRELIGFEKITAVSPNIIYPQWVENGTELCMELLDLLLKILPVYELSCRPDKESVEIVRGIVFSK